MIPDSRVIRFRSLLLAASACFALPACQCGHSGSFSALVLDREPQPIAHLEFRSGPGAIERGKKRFPAELGYVFANDSFDTGPAGRLTLRFAEEQVVEVGPDTQVALGEDKRGIVLKTARGALAVRTSAQGIDAGRERAEAPPWLSVQAPFGQVRPNSRPSAVSIQAAPDATRVQVVSGSAEIVSRSGGTTRALAGEAFVLSANSLERLPPDAFPLAPSSRAPALQIRALAQAAQAEIRKKDAKRWSKLPGQGAAIAEKDWLRVNDGRLVLALGSTAAQLIASQGTEFAFEKFDLNEGAQEPSFELVKGELVFDVGKRGRQRIALSGLHLASDDAGQFSLAKIGNVLELTALAGDLGFTSQAAEGKLLAGQVATFSGANKPSVEEVDRADLVLPSRPGLKVFHQELDWVALNWDGGRRDYRVEVASDSSFSQIVLQGTVHRSYVNVPAPSRGLLFWRVLDAAAKRQVSRGNATFAPETPTRDLARVRNEVPDGTEKTTIYYEDKAPAITFTYKGEPSAAKYRVAVFRADALNNPVVERVVVQNKAALEPGVLTEGSYLWAVTPLSEAGEELKGGKMNKLDLVYENSVPSLVIRSPRNGELVKGSRVQVAGIAPVGSRVLVNGKAAPLDEKNRFEMAIAPVGQPPLVIFRLIHPPESDVFTVRSLRRGR